MLRWVGFVPEDLHWRVVFNIFAYQTSYLWRFCRQVYRDKCTEYPRFSRRKLVILNLLHQVFYSIVKHCQASLACLDRSDQLVLIPHCKLAMVTEEGEEVKRSYLLFVAKYNVVTIRFSKTFSQDFSDCNHHISHCTEQFYWPRLALTYWQLVDLSYR